MYSHGLCDQARVERSLSTVSDESARPKKTSRQNVNVKIAQLYAPLSWLVASWQWNCCKKRNEFRDTCPEIMVAGLLLRYACTRRLIFP